MSEQEQEQLYSEFYDFCRKGDVSRVTFYLNANLNAKWTNQRDRNRSLLMATAWKDSEEACQLLIASGASVDHQDATQMTALHICAKQNSRRVAKLLVKNKANPNLMTETGITPLMICADLGHDDIGRLLINYSATNLNLQSHRGFTALMKAVFENSEQLALLLVDKGAKLNLASVGGFTALHLCAQLNRPMLAEKMLESGHANDQRELINLPTRDKFKGNTAFTLAALNGHTAMLQLLHRAGADIFHRNVEGMTALDQLKAVGGASSELLDLMESWYRAARPSGDPQQPTQPPPDPLYTAVLEGNADQALSLIATIQQAGPDASEQLNQLDPRTGQTPLMLAAALNSHVIVGHLLDHLPATAVDYQPPGHLGTALHAAVQHVSEDCVKLLLAKGANAGLQDADGATPMHLCAELHQCVASEAIARLLLNSLANSSSLGSLHAVDKDGRSPAEIAAVRGNVGLLRLLLARGVATNQEALKRIGALAEKARQFQAANAVLEYCAPATPKDTEDRQVSQLYTAAMEGKTQAVKELLEKSPQLINKRCARDPQWTALMATAWSDDDATCQLLLSRGADPNVKDTKLGITALHIAVQQDSQKVARKLMAEKSIDLNVTSWDQRTPLIRAAWLDHRAIGQILLDRSASVNAQEQDGFSALHFCAQENLLEFAKLLVCHDANLELQTSAQKNSNTAFTLAAIKGHEEMLELLANVGANIYHRSTRGDAMELATKARNAKTVEVLHRLDSQQHGAWERANDAKGSQLLERGFSQEVSGIVADTAQVQAPRLPAAEAADLQQNLFNSTQLIPLILGSQYSMKSSPRGICVIVNNYEFAHPDDCRRGSAKDLENLSRLFKEVLNFRVQAHQNLDACDILALMRSLAADDRHSKYDCFAAFIMSHGQDGKVMGCDGKWLSLDDVYGLFGRCRSLEGKPKLFFVQACREPTHATSVAAESNVDAPSLAGAAASTNQQQRQQQQQTRAAAPEKVDFLFAYATVKGDPALRHTEQGSLYIQTLCRVLTENYRTSHLCTMLNMVRSELSRLLHRLDRPGLPTLYLCNVPSETTQLRGEVWF